MFVDTDSKYDTELKFVNVYEKYSTESGKKENIILSESKQYATSYKMSLVNEEKSYGTTTNEVYVLTIIGFYNSDFNYIFFNNDYYDVVERISFKLKETFVVRKANVNLARLIEDEEIKFSKINTREVI